MMTNFDFPTIALTARFEQFLEDLAKVKRIVAEIAKDTAVLNADDPHCLKMADHTQSKNLCYVTMNSAHPLVRDHIRAGGRAVVLEQGMGGHMIAIYDNNQHIPLLWSHLVPATLDGRALHNVQNAMFASGIAFSMGVDLEEIRHGLRTFSTTFFQAPGRMNICDDHPFKVIMDYAHNPAAVSAMVDLVQRMEPKGKRTVVVAAPGDRRDEDVCEIANLCAGKFDHYICRRDDGLRGRESDEIPMMLRDALLDAGVPSDCIEVIPDEKTALDHALNMSKRDDLLLVFVDAIGRSWKQIQEFQSDDVNGENEDQLVSHAIDLDGFTGFEDFDMNPDMEIIQDERGVRIAAQEESD